jgi:hypothetical protein
MAVLVRAEAVAVLPVVRQVLASRAQAVEAAEERAAAR